MPDIDLDAIEARANAATQGPWRFWNDGWVGRLTGNPNVASPPIVAPIRDAWHAHRDGPCPHDTSHSRADAEFIAHARTDVPALVALVRAKQSWIDGAKVDLDGYADDQAEYEVAVRALTAEVRRLREDADEGDALRTKLADLLSRTAVALNGPEPDLVQWSWHDLPEKAQYAMTLLLAVKSYDDANQSDLPLGLLDSIRAICAALDVRHDPSATTDGGEG